MGKIRIYCTSLSFGSVGFCELHMAFLKPLIYTHTSLCVYLWINVIIHVFQHPQTLFWSQTKVALLLHILELAASSWSQPSPCRAW